MTFANRDSPAHSPTGSPGTSPERFDVRGFAVRIGAEVKNFDAESVIRDRQLLKFATRPHRFALAAAEEALTDAGIRPEPDTAARWGFSVGAGMMSVAFDELKTVHTFCGTGDDFEADEIGRAHV